MIDFSKKTYAAILEDQKARVSDKIDKREGSLILTALSPASWYMEGMYLDLDRVQKNARAETAGGNDLDMIVAERGIQRKGAIHAVKKGIFNIMIPIGSRFSALAGNEYITYIAEEYIGVVEEGYSYCMRCELAGEIGNSYSGQLIAVDYVIGLTSASLTDVIVYGTEEEKDDFLRDRYFATFEVAAFGGNIAAYRNAVLEIEGVGAVQVYPAWKGGGTVLCSILNENLEPATTELVKKVQDIICPSEEGEMEPSANGYGMAPIGAVATICTGQALTLNVSLRVTFASNIVDGVATYKNQIESKIDGYLSSVRSEWGKAIKGQKIQYLVTVYVSRIIYEILTISEIVNVTDVLINGAEQDVSCIETKDLQQVPVMGTVTINGS